MPTNACCDAPKVKPRRSRLTTLGTVALFFSFAGFLSFLGVLYIAPFSDPFDDGPPLTETDWPQWRGIHRDGHANEATIADTWPESGPERLWAMPIGAGFSSVSVRGPDLFVSSAIGDQEFLLRLDAVTGEEKWRLPLGELFEEEYGNGPRSTPTIHGGVVLALSSRGRLVAAEIETGSTLWAVELHEQFGRKSLSRGYASSPLVEGDLVILNTAVAVGNGPSIAALNRSNGRIVWTSGIGRSAACSPIGVTIDDERQIVTAYANGLEGISAIDGKTLWQFPWATEFGLNVATPVLVAPDKFLISAAYSQGSALVQVTREPVAREPVTREPVARKRENEWVAKEVWTNKRFRNHFNTSIFHDGYLYGFDNAILQCIDATDGKKRWHAREYGKGSLILVDEKLIVLSEKGELALVRADPEKHHELARVQVLSDKCWTTPTFANDLLYVRNHHELVCLRLTPCTVP